MRAEAHDDNDGEADDPPRVAIKAADGHHAGIDSTSRQVRSTGAVEATTYVPRRVINVADAMSGAE